MTSSRMRTPEWLRRLTASCKDRIAIALALGLVASGCAALLMFTSGYLISATAHPGVVLFSVLVPVAFVQLFGFGRPLARYLERLVSHDWVLRITSALRKALFDSALESACDPAKTSSSGDYLNLVIDDIAHLQNLYLRVVFPCAIALALGIGSAVAFGLFSAPFGLLMFLCFAVIAFLIPTTTLIVTRSRVLKCGSAKHEGFSRLTDDVLGAFDWALSGRAKQAVERHGACDVKTRIAEGRIRLAERTFGLISQLALGFLACVVVAWSAGLFSGDAASANWIAAFALGFFPLIEAFAALPAAYADLTRHEGSIARLDAHIADDPGQPRTEALVVTEDADITLKDVTYSYPQSQRKALDNVSLHILSGQHVAIIGKSGAGKSTLASIVRGAITPDVGELLIGGSPACAHDLDFSTAVGHLSHRCHLFNRTLRENLTIGHAADDATLLEALANVGLSGKLASLPDGLDTVVGETGVGFSGGEAHRIALARILVANPQIVVVDEPFAALDPITERALTDTLLRACADKTLIVITHHLAEIARFDRVVFVEDGHVTLDGTPCELMRISERFRTWVALDASISC